MKSNITWSVEGNPLLLQSYYGALDTYLGVTEGTHVEGQRMASLSNVYHFKESTVKTHIEIPQEGDSKLTLDIIAATPQKGSKVLSDIIDRLETFGYFNIRGE